MDRQRPIFWVVKTQREAVSWTKGTGSKELWFGHLNFELLISHLVENSSRQRKNGMKFQGENSGQINDKGKMIKLWMF